MWDRARCRAISFPMVDLSLPIVFAMAVLEEPFLIPTRMIWRSANVRCEKELVLPMNTFLSVDHQTMESVQQNATKWEVEMGERVKSTSPPSEWK